MTNEYLAGNSVISIAKKYGVTREAVYARLRKMPNWNVIKEKKKIARAKKRMQKHEHLRDKVFEMAKNGTYRAEIKRELGVSRKVIETLLRGTKYDRSQTAKMPIHNEIRRDFGRGMTRKELMEKYEMSYPHICRIIKKYNIK